MGDEKEGGGSEAVLDDPEQLIAAFEDFGLHTTALTWLFHPGSSAWQVAKNLKLPHQD